ncbi:uncharacterized protein LOC131628871 [Vicia villosa]|uniref:uncharacterized protein LOC131628871 n=1 Tax=Vicia villosa TaxID=3911 RepID=UPI00273A8D4C|nr:uncharacterized protein LOC131628871 [Vicia villosa]
MKTVTCYNCSEEGHISPQCTKPKKNQSSGKIVIFPEESSVEDLVMTTKQVNEAVKDGAAMFILFASMKVKGKAIAKRVGEVPYRIALPPALANLHNVFHVSQLRKYIADPSHVIQVDNVKVRDNLTVEALPMTIEDRKLKQLRGKEIALMRNQDVTNAIQKVAAAYDCRIVEGALSHQMKQFVIDANKVVLNLNVSNPD